MDTVITLTLSRLLQQANRFDAYRVPRIHLTYQLIFITPKGTVKTLGVVGKADFADFAQDYAEDVTVRVRLQPSVYTNSLLPYRDNLKAQLVVSDLTNRVVTEYTAIPLLGGDPRLSGDHSSLASLDGISAMTFQLYDFQLLDPLYATLRDQVVSGISLMGQVATTLPYLLDRYTQQFATKENYKQVRMELPVDNTQTYSSIVIPEGTSLPGLPGYLQNSEKYGVYAKGLGCFFKQGYWWIYSLFDVSRYDRHPQSVDLYRLPPDKIPTLDNTFFVNQNGLTILSTGDAHFDDEGDIGRQEEGVGARLILSSKVSGETGSYYNAGRSIQTRADSMAEFQIAERGSGNHFTPVLPTPTSNPLKYLSALSVNEGVVMTLEWQNSDTGLLEPGCPCRYWYLNGDTLSSRKGVILGYRTDYQVIDNKTLIMKRSTVLTVFLANAREENG